MFKFKRNMQSMNGKGFRAGMLVPENFSTLAGLAEMVKVGDIEEVKEKSTQNDSPVIENSEEIAAEVKPAKRAAKKQAEG